MMASRGLRNLFHPIDPGEILGAADENRLLFRHTDRSEMFARLLPWATLNTLILSEKLLSGSMGFWRQGRKVPWKMLGLSARKPDGDWPTADLVQSLCDQGMSIVLNNIGDDVPAIAAMNAMVERYLRCNTHTNAYASFKHDSAFGAHYDSHNVLVLQLHGSKRWWSHGQVASFPQEGKVFRSLEELPPAEWEGVLEPGDILFLPRGHVHRATANDTYSVHLAIGLTPPNGEDVLKWLARQALASERARQYIPAHAAPRALNQHCDDLRAMLHQMADKLDLADFLADADLARAPARPLNLGLSQALALATHVQPALRRRIALPPVHHGEARLCLGDMKVTLTVGERDVLAKLLDEDAMSLAELAEALPETDVKAAVASLARKSLIFLFEPS